MVKIIIELSEEYIAQMSDLDNVKKVEMGGVAETYSML